MPSAADVPLALKRVWFRSRRAAVLLLLASLPAAASLAADLGYGFGSYLSYESNINRTEVNPSRELTAAFFAGLSYSETAGDVTGRIYTYFERRQFTQQTNQDDNRLFLEANGTWSIMPKRFVWIFEDTFQQVLLNLTAPSTPSNQAKTNSLSTGPELIIPMSSVNSFVTGARYGRFDIENSTSDNVRYRGYGRIVHTNPAHSRFSLNYEASRVFFEPGNPFQVVDRQDAFVSYQTLSADEGVYAGDSVSADIGKSRVIQHAGDFRNALDGHLARVRLSKAISPHFAVNAGYSDRISDTYSDMIAGIAGSQVPMEGGVVIVQGGALATIDYYHVRRADMGFTAHGGDIEYTFQPYARTVDFQTLDQDYSETGGSFFWRWSFSGATRWQAFVSSSVRKYDSLERRDADRIFGMSLDFKLNRTLRLGFAAGQTQRQSTAIGASYVDQRFLVLLGYSSNYQLRTVITN